ncbi:hypothetical protein [Bacillus massilioanorexius]|uniref:hypothetical protein n=1 Tax=Bacillus massilioanorexius TaxID=1468413 RepID=UPI0011DD3529|nr:hypothetical protein [Bacillus massilioanorexius]
MLLLSSCFKKEDLEQPIKDYFLKEYGIKEEIKILSTDNNWLEGIAHQTYVEIKKPYHTVIFLWIERDTYEINKDPVFGDDVFLEIFKGAYIEQNKEVIKLSDEIINNYHLVREFPNDEIKGKVIPYYLNVRIDEKQKNDLKYEFVSSQKLDTKEIIPKLTFNKVSENGEYAGTINFNYYYNIYQNSPNIPKAEAILKEYERSRVLTEGVYRISISIMEHSLESLSYGSEESSSVLFRVNHLGEFQIISVENNQ